MSMEMSCLAVAIPPALELVHCLYSMGGASPRTPSIFDCLFFRVGKALEPQAWSAFAVCEHTSREVSVAGLAGAVQTQQIEFNLTRANLVDCVMSKLDLATRADGGQRRRKLFRVVPGSVESCSAPESSVSVELRGLRGRALLTPARLHRHPGGAVQRPGGFALLHENFSEASWWCMRISWRWTKRGLPGLRRPGAARESPGGARVFSRGVLALHERFLAVNGSIPRASSRRWPVRRWREARYRLRGGMTFIE